MDQREFEEQFGEMGIQVERDLIWAMLSRRRMRQRHQREFDEGNTELEPRRRDLAGLLEADERAAKVALAAVWQWMEAPE